MPSSEPTPAEPFRVAIADAVLDDLRSRLHATRLPASSADDWNGDINPTYLRELVAWWRDGFDWRAAEARLNVYAHYRASVDGTVVHFVHERGRGRRPLPIVLT